MSKIHDVNKREPAITKTAIAIAGPVDSGKSSFVGVCTSGVLDDGRGSAREKVAKHKHEITSGQTSDISTRMLKLNDGRDITFIDLCGHEKYLKTTVRGVSGYFPDYACLIISPHRGVTDIAKQHFKMLVSQNIPIFIIITRVDNSLEASCRETTQQITALCRNTTKQKADFINSYDDYVDHSNGKVDDEVFAEKKIQDTDSIIEHLQLNKNGKQGIIPVITVSNVNGYYIDVCKNAMNKMEPRDIWNQNSKNNRIIKSFQAHLKLNDDEINREFDGSVFYIDSSFMPKGIGLVVSGILRGNQMKVNDTLYMGPFGKEFVEVKIRSMHNNSKEDIGHIDDHGRGCCAISVSKSAVSIKRNNIKKGIVLVTKNQRDKICYRFKAAVHIFSEKSVSVRPGYSPVINVGTVSQSARVLKDESFEEEIKTENGENSGEKRIIKKNLGSGSIVSMWFKFRQKPEHVSTGSLLTFRSGEIHGVGMVIETLSIVDDDDAKPDVARNGRSKQQANKDKTLAHVPTQKYKKVDIKL